MRRSLFVLVLLVAVAAVAFAVHARLDELDVAAGPAAERGPVPIEVAPIERGSIELRRTFSGTLEASAEFAVAPKVSGRVKRIAVDLGDTVTRGQVVALLDDEEFVQSVAQADADLAVARASESEALSALEIAERGLRRAEALREEGMSSESLLDNAKSSELAARAHVAVTRANATRAESALETARIRSSYARITADWSEGDDQRVVADRRVDEGEIVSANTALLSIVDLDPIVGVVYVPERDYAGLSVGQRATLTTDSYPGQTFDGEVARIAPVFRSATRQARIELAITNHDERLRPGMFVRATLELASIDDAIALPFDALTLRGGRTGVFVVDAAGTSVKWRPVEVGIRDGARVEVRGEGLAGNVVVLGQELCDDGARVVVRGFEPADAGTQAP